MANGSIYNDSTGLLTTIRDTFYPVGSVYISKNGINPGSFIGGTWKQIKDRVIMAAGDNYAAGSTGGATTHTHTTSSHALTVNEMPAHGHERGTQDITGSIRVYNDFDKLNAEVEKQFTGAFYWQSSWDTDTSRARGSTFDLPSGEFDTVRRVPFQASRSWTGVSSSVGGSAAHNHGNTGSASNLPPYTVYYVWERTS